MAKTKRPEPHKRDRVDDQLGCAVGHLNKAWMMLINKKDLEGVGYLTALLNGIQSFARQRQEGGR